MVLVITLMMIMSASLLFMLMYVQSLRAQRFLFIYMLYSVLYTCSHFMGVAYTSIYTMSFWLLLFLLHPFMGI